MKIIYKYVAIFMLLSFFSRSQALMDSLNASPNPFQNGTLLYYSFTNNDTVSIKVYMEVGSIVTPIINTFSDSIMAPGVYHDSLIMSSYPDGVYFVGLHLGTRKTIMKKIVKTATAGINSNAGILENAKIYPNPTNDILNIYLPENRLIDKIEISNSNGQLIREEEITFKNNQAKFTTAGLSNGVYYVNLNGINKRFVVAK